MNGDWVSMPGFFGDANRALAWRSRILRYGVAALAVGVALLLKLILETVIVQEAPFLLVFAAVMVSAWYGGLGPGLAATALAGLVTDYYFLPPRGAFSGFGLEAVPLYVFFVEGAVMSVLTTALRAARYSAEMSALEAQARQEDQRRSEESFRLLVESVRDYAIFMLDPDGRVAGWNAGAQRLKGYRPKEIIGEHLSRFYRDIDIERGEPERALKVAAAEGRFEDGGWRLRKDGSLFWANFVITALRDEDGNLRGFSTVTRDDTQRRQAQVALRENEERYRAVVENAAEGIFLCDVRTKRIVDSNAALGDLLGYTSDELRGLTLYDIVAHDRASVDRHVERIRGNKKCSIGERRYRRKDGSLVHVEVSASEISYGEREVLSVVAHDVTERKNVEDRLRHSLNSLLALYEAGQVLSSTLERKEIGSKLLGIMRRVAGFDAAAIYVKEGQDGQLRMLHTIGTQSLWHRARGTPEARAARRRGLESGQRQLFRTRLGGEDPETGGAEGHLVGLFVPLRVREQIVGALEVYGSETLSEGETVGTLAGLSGQAASALENGRLYEELAEHERRLEALVRKLLVAQEEERRNVAYDIHDGLTQVAIATYQNLQAFAEDFPPPSAEAREQLDLSLDLAQRTVREARQVIAGLRPTALDDFGLASAIRLQVEALSSEGWQVSFEEALGDERLPVAVETALFRVAQEALTNVRKHARTTRVRVALRRLEGAVRLEVEDWGRGFRPSAVENGGGRGERVGLSSMRERVTLLGGHFEIRSKPSAGTLLVATVPLAGRENGHGE